MKKKYAKISYEDYGSYIEELSNLISSMSGEWDGIVEYADVGQAWAIEIIEMEEEEYKKLPEFTGW